VARRWPSILTLLAFAWWTRTALITGKPLDYHFDAAPPIDALARLDISGFFQAAPLMGPVSLVVRAPFAAMAGGDQLLAYRLGALPCLAAMAVLLYVLLRRMQSAGHPALAGAAIAGLFAIDPLVGGALTWGHPEEILGGALCILAILAAGAGRTWTAAIVLGLAVTTKQWAVVAIVPTLLAAPAGRRAIALGAGGLAAAFTAPLLLISSSSVGQTAKAIGSVQSWIAPPNVWWPLAQRSSHQAFDGVAMRTVYDYALPSVLNPVPHALIVIVAVALGVALWVRAPRPSLDQVLGLLALVFLLRCMLDPWNNLYYHVPFLLALFARDAVAAPRRPLAAAFGLAFVWLTFKRVWPAAQERPDLVFAFYVAWSTVFAGWLAVSVFAPARLPVLGARRASLALSPR
jgi:hypothetical protein